MSVKCPICGKSRKNKQDVIDHVEHNHMDEIPEEYTTAQYIYSLVHGRDHGLCRVCGQPTEWNEKTGKPKQLCGSKSCAQKRRIIAQRNMIRVYGTDNLLKDPLHQEKMLANRKISGKYTWSDNKHTFTYTGSYEKFALEWLDKVYEYDPDDIMMPGPIINYDLNGEEHPWITDMYLESLNLVIEFKDGSYDKNTHEGFKGNREREKAKDEHMQHQTKYNYTKITNKNMMDLVKIISMIRLDNIFGDEKHQAIEKPVIVINETVEEDDSYKYLSNDEIFAMSESISNNSTMMFGDGINSAIVDSNCQGFTIQENNELTSRLQAIKENSQQMYSDSHDDVTWNPLDSTDNFKEKLVEDGRNTNLYFLSQDNMNNKTLSPRIPDNFFTKNGYEDKDIKRICFTPSIDKCLMGLSQNLKDKEFFVHIPTGKYQPSKPTPKQVPDSKITDEYWITDPVKVSCVGKIRVISDDGKPGHKFKYGDNKDAELYGWNYEWLEKYHNVSESVENTKSPEREDLETNPETRTDIDTDPSSYGDNDASTIAHDVLDSNFENVNK